MAKDTVVKEDKGYYGAGYGKFANMPSDANMKDYPMPKHFMGERLNDTISGIDETLNDTATKVSRSMSKSMY